MRTHFSKGGLRQWVAEKWVDIGAPKKDGSINHAGDRREAKGSIQNASHLQKPHG